MTKWFSLPKLPRNSAHYLFAIIQSGLTAAIASAIATVRLANNDISIIAWVDSWLVSWVTMVPIVLLAAPMIRRLTLAMTDEKE